MKGNERLKDGNETRDKTALKVKREFLASFSEREEKKNKDNENPDHNVRIREFKNQKFLSYQDSPVLSCCSAVYSMPEEP